MLAYYINLSVSAHICTNMKHVNVPLLSAELSPPLQKVKAQSAGSSQAVKFTNINLIKI